MTVVTIYCALSLAAQCIVIGPVFDSGVCNRRAGGVRTLLQPARAQCLRLSERFFIDVWYADERPSNGGRTQVKS